MKLIVKLKNRYRYSLILLQQLIKTDYKLRYQGSVLGYLWSLLRPLLMFTILYFVFVRFLKISNDIPHPAVYLLLGIVLWNYFVEVTTASVGAIVGKGELLRKINFPKYIIIIAVSMSALINLFFNFVVIAVFMGLNHVDLSWRAIFIFPLLLELFVVSLAMAFILSALYVKLRDVSPIWDVVIQAGFYVTPILYLLSRLPHVLAKLALLNPLAQIVQDSRYALITTQSTTIGKMYNGRYWVWLIPIGICLGLAVLGVVYFRAQSKSFAEEV